MEVTVIDDRDHVGWAAAATRIGEIYMTSVRTMADNVLSAIGKNKMSRLNILDHGNPTSIQIGSDRISLVTLPSFSAQLQRLNGHFTAEGFVHLQHCKIGQNRTLLVALARLFGVPVYAGTGLHNPVYRFNLGDYVRCNPDGTCTVNVRRPGSSPPPSRSGGPWSNPNKVCCFPSGTPIRTCSGVLPIEALESGMHIFGWNSGAERVQPARVIQRQEHIGSFVLRTLQTGRGKRISVTGDHRFALSSGTWVASQQLGTSDILATLHGLDKITEVLNQDRVVSKVFNLKVEDLQSYYVGDNGLRVRDY